MDCKTTAKKALEKLRDDDKWICTSNDRDQRRSITALNGLLEGIAEGRITTGQRLIGEIILAKPSSANPNHDFDEELVRQLFSSGICSEGQQLSNRKVAKEKWIERS